MALQIPRPVVDEDSIRRTIARVATAEFRDADDNETGNDWSWLLDGQPPLDEKVFLQDLFVLCRTTPGLFGPALLDGQVEACGPADEGDPFISVSIVAEIDSLRISGRRWVLHEFIGLKTSLPVRDAVVACLLRIGHEAEHLAAEYERVVNLTP